MAIEGAVVFDVGRVLFAWDLRHLFTKLIPDPDRLDWFVTTVVTPEWHFQHDAGRPLADMVAERIAAFPDCADLIAAYAARFNETIPGPVPGMVALVERLDAAGVPLFAITNFGDVFWAMFRPTQPLFDRFRDIVVSGTERLIKPDPAIYHLAIERFGIDAPSALFIDDNADNVAGSIATGLPAVQFRDAATLERDLIARGFLR